MKDLFSVSLNANTSDANMITVFSNVSERISIISVSSLGFPAIENFSKTWEERIGLLAMLAVFQVVGLAGNTLILIVAVKRLRRLETRQVHNAMIFALAIGDVAALILYATFYQAGQYVLNSTLCKLWQFIGLYAVMYVHFLLCCAIPLERYFTICRPNSRFDRRKGIITMTTVMIGVIPLALMYALYTDVTDSEGRLVGCHFNYDSYEGHVIPVIAFVFGLAAVVSAVVMYSLIFTRIVRLQKQSNPNQDGVELATKCRWVVMLLGVTLVYMLSYFPYFLLAFRAIPYDNRLKGILFINNASNFIVYSTLNRRMRKEMLQVFPCSNITLQLLSGRTHKTKCSPSGGRTKGDATCTM